MKNGKLAAAFLASHGQSAACIDVASALKALNAEIDLGLQGLGGLPMLPSYINPARLPVLPPDSTVIDIGGTTLRRANVHWAPDGSQTLRNVKTCPLSQIGYTLEETAFFKKIVEFAGVKADGLPLAVSYSYNMESLPGPDAKMLGWCKELVISNPTGDTVAQALRRAAGMDRLPVSVLNDSVASMLGCGLGASLGIIVGTGFNMCATLPCGQIQKLENPGQYGTHMVVNTEVGESRAFVPGAFEVRVIAASEEPAAAQAEKQVAGRYLEQTIMLALEQARKEGLITEDCRSLTLPQLGQLALGEDLTACIVAEAIHRSAKIAAICLYAFLGRVDGAVQIATEGSVLQKMPRYSGFVKEELAGLLGRDVPEFLATDYAGIRGAARLALPL